MFLCFYLKSLKLISDAKNMNERVEKRIQKGIICQWKRKKSKSGWIFQIVYNIVKKGTPYTKMFSWNVRNGTLNHVQIFLIENQM